jgi:organic anion transporter 4A
MMAIIGPALGFGLGGLFLSVYVDPSVNTHLTPRDPGWVGAWWLCYIVCGVLCLVIAFPFFLYPRLLPNSSEIRELREREMALRGERSCRELKSDGELRV